MKKIFFTLSLILSVIGGINAQVTFQPAVFTAQDSVVLTVDVTGTPMAGQTEAYIWIFSNPVGSTPTGFTPKDGFTNTAWTNSPVSAKMIAAGTNKWSFGFVATRMFSQTPGELNTFGFLVKAKDGSKQTPDYKPYKFDALVFTPTTLRIFPSRVGQNDVITLNFDQSLSAVLDEQRMTPTSATVTAFNGSTQIGTAVTLTIKKLSDKTWSAIILPSRSFTIPTGGKISTIKYRFNGTVLSPSGAPMNVSSTEAEVALIDMK